MLFAPRLHVVAEQHILVAQVQFAVGNNRVRPSWLSAAVGLLEAATLEVFLRVWLNQEHGTVLGAIVEPAIGQSHRAFRRAALAAALIPQNVAGLEVETDEVTAGIAAVGAIQAAFKKYHTAVVVLHPVGEIDFLGLDTTVCILAQLHQPPAVTIG